MPDDYPLPITWSGILVSDPGHPEDIVARVRDAADQAAAIRLLGTHFSPGVAQLAHEARAAYAFGQALYEQQAKFDPDADPNDYNSCT